MSNNDEFLRKLDPTVVDAIRKQLDQLPNAWKMDNFYWGTEKVVNQEQIENTILFGPWTALVATGTPITNPLAQWNGVQLVFDDKLVGWIDSFTISVQPQNRGISFTFANQGIQVLRNDELIIPQTEHFPTGIRQQFFAQWATPSPEPIQILFEPIQFRAQDRLKINLYNMAGQNAYFTYMWQMRFEKSKE